MKSAANKTFDKRLFDCLLCRTRSTIGFNEENELFLIGGQLVIISTGYHFNWLSFCGDFDEKGIVWSWGKVETETLLKKEGGQLVIILIGEFDETETLPKKEPARLIIRFDKLNQSTNTETAV